MTFTMMTPRQDAARDTSESSSRGRARIAILLALLFTLGLPRSYSQTEEQKKIPSTTVYFMFFHYQASDAERRASMTGQQQTSAVEDKAALLGISPQDVAAVDEAAAAFVAQEKALAEEALKYERECAEAHRPVDPATLHTFSTRRESLALAALSAIRAQLSTDTFEALERFLDTKFREGLHPVKVRGR